MWAFLDRPRDRFEIAAQFWCAVTGSTLSARRGDLGQWATFLPPNGSAHVKLQAVDVCRGGHLDLEVADIDVAVDHALGVGARLLARDRSLAVLSSPAGLPWCVVPWHGSTTPAPPVQTPGGTIRVDQVALDLAPADFAVERDFWAAITGWSLVASVRQEFTLLVPPKDPSPDPAGSARPPVRLLLQRLDDPAPARMHVDLACADVPAATAYHCSVGASIVARHEFWTVMRDPSGEVYCLTRRDPFTGRVSPG